ncbi:hypothetical protein [Parvularcula lutaonensis]|uniref:Nicotinamide riboside transporter PnuC n=1 Tax=Parvularcula lutaonensis TaxID=491923 RepID=A0ABV7M9P9_9PROT|nr:hypothetical protein [Parvularcula lutaonensis]GGY43004.1 hypothetical protein GCM10007148_09620 [Parvularcula lutaonensis]
MTFATLLEWAATGSGIVAAVIVSLNLGPTKTGWGFVVFTFSSVCWIATAVIQGETALTIQNAVLFVINVIGIWRYLLADSVRGQAAGSGGVTQTTA